MGISYKPLFRLLVDKEMTKTDLRAELGFSSATLAKLGKGEPISGAVIEKLCTYFRCRVQDIVEITLDD
jgi:DNA-binding Xre family transcriptional regulator